MQQASIVQESMKTYRIPDYKNSHSHCYQLNPPLHCVESKLSPCCAYGSSSSAIQGHTHNILPGACYLHEIICREFFVVLFPLWFSFPSMYIGSVGTVRKSRLR